MGKGNGKNNAFLPNIEWMIKAGIDYKTGLPIKMGKSGSKLKDGIKRALRILDEQDAVNRGKWYNIPCDLTSQDLERLLYYKGQLCLFYSKDLEQFFILPFTLCSDKGNGLDVYGRYNYIKPVPLNASSEEDKRTPIEIYLSSLCLKVVYSPKEIITEDDLYNSAVIIRDYTPQFDSTSIVPRSFLQEDIIDVMSDCIPFMRTSLLLGTGVTGVRVQDGDQANEVAEACNAMETKALKGEPWIPLTSTLEFQELTNTTKTNNSEEYMLAMQSLDNFRLSLYGIDNGGLFEKKAHELQSEADINGGPVGLVLQDKVTISQNACNIANSIWDIGLWYEPSETIIKADTNGDGMVYDRDDSSTNGGTDTSTEEGGEDND